VGVGKREVGGRIPQVGWQELRDIGELLQHCAVCL